MHAVCCQRFVPDNGKINILDINTTLEIVPGFGIFDKEYTGRVCKCWCWIDASRFFQGREIKMSRFWKIKQILALKRLGNEDKLNQFAKEHLSKGDKTLFLIESFLQWLKSQGEKT